MGSICGRSYSSRVGRFVYRTLYGFPFLREADPVHEDEWLLRKVPRNWYKEGAPSGPFQRVAFEPRKGDIDGISFFRQLFVSPSDLSTAGWNPPYYIARIRAKGIIELGLSYRATPDASQPPGHVSIPELTYDEFKKNKTVSKDLQIELAAACTVAFSPRPDTAGTTMGMLAFA